VVEVEKVDVERSVKMKFLWFGSGFGLGLVIVSLSFASVPSRVTNDVELYRNLTELRMKKEREIVFDQDLAQLSSLEKRYQETLPSLKDHPRLQGPMQRIQETRYR
jgi:hypothetical protein